MAAPIILDKIKKEASKAIVGQDDLLTDIIVCFFTNGHILLRGLPGLAKTTIIKVIAKVFGANFNRVQFTPDLMPNDLIGYEILEENKGKKSLKFIQGPIFTNLLLADEINRTPPKTQSSLLQAMQEKQVTVMGKTYTLDEPFLVMATQNPIEQEGTYPLPEAQLDRFLFLLNVEYPSYEEEIIISTFDAQNKVDDIKPVFKLPELKRHMAATKKIKIADKVVDWIVKLVHATRPDSKYADKEVKEYVAYGASPRASMGIISAAKSYAYLEGKTKVEKHHIEKVIFPILRHRIIMNFSGEAQSYDVETLIKNLLKIKL